MDKPVEKTETPPPYTCKEIFPEELSITLDDCIHKVYLWNASPDKWKGRVLFIHGYRDSHNLYLEFGETLAKAGYDFFYYYQRGEGESKLITGGKGVADDRHAYAGVDNFIKYNLKDLKSKGLPEKLHLIGHSMGGGIVLNYAAEGKYKDKLASFCTIGPLVTLHPETYPGLPIEYVVRTICFLGGKNLRVNSPLKAEHIAGDKAYQKYIEDNTDPRGLDGAFIETRDMILRGRNLLSKQKYTKVDKHVPMLLCHGEADYINDKEGSIKWHKLLNSVEGMENKEIAIYEEGRHNLLIDKDHIKSKILDDVLNFLNKC